ncbi:ABC transporter ATP-binding protein [Thermosphaera aggregans]|jgi:putative ABC transport system ATP-binding protein|uniref:ABC transporter related protein n=1 Tax=Thermosphaera aggregans (strain DSM 11486 / M11TL) TaxID=633148 RepID=D5U0M4_THEAM|nr:ABC transporter ATP-binding protein [Thermosphaera aggregans]ADG90674.1 ABC transporter related protein [Thermosphaera aggregans DSM 11486]
MSEIIKLINVKKVYRVGSVETVALKGVSMSISKGDLLSIMGPSGSGKTTLLNMIGLLDKPTEGNILVEGVDVTRLTSDQIADIRNRKIGFVFQQFNLINRLTVLENIELPLIARGVPRNIRVKKAVEALRLAGGDESWLRKRPSQLSGGQQQRVAIARALVGSPELILADEPTGNLDRKSARLVVETFLKLNESGIAVCVVTHDPEIANCTRKVFIIRDGSIMSVEEPDKDKCILHTVQG